MARNADGEFVPSLVGVTDREILLVGEVTEKSAFDLQLALRRAIKLEQRWALENDVSPRPLTLIINSGGGTVTDSFALYELILGSPIPIHTHATGYCASAATLLLLAGSTRTIGPESRLMVHQMTSSTEGSVAELEISLTETKTLQSMIAKIYQTRTRLTKAAIVKLFLQDSWMGPTKAVKLGFAHRILAK